MDRSTIADLVDQRAELLDLPAASRTAEQQDTLARATETLKTELAGGSHVVRRVGPDEPGDLLDRLAAREPVHPIAGPDDLADRLAADRRCFVLEHPRLPGRPMNVVWVALWTGVPDDLADILDPAAPTADPHRADTAVFYSIWNVEDGLVGLPGGRSLITGTVDALSSELPGLSTFVTLSPVPGFRRWLERHRGELAARLATPSPSEIDLDAAVAECARYLTSCGTDGRLLDPVARFHMGNGARLLRINRDADRSERGLRRSFGIMANYRYAPEDRPANRDRLRNGRPAVGSAVADLLTTTD